MSALDMAIQMADMSYGLDDRLRPDDLIMSASKELADLRSEKSRLAQENIRLNNNEDFLDSRIAELEEAQEAIVCLKCNHWKAEYRFGGNSHFKNWICTGCSKSCKDCTCR